MRIEPDPRNIVAESGSATASANAKTSTKASAPATEQTAGGVRSGDRAEFSSLHSRTAGLAAQANQLSEIRRERVAALASAINKGTYQVSPEQTADAILSELHARRGAAA